MQQNATSRGKNPFSIQNINDNRLRQIDLQLNGLVPCCQRGLYFFSTLHINKLQGKNHKRSRRIFSGRVWDFPFFIILE